MLIKVKYFPPISYFTSLKKDIYILTIIQNSFPPPKKISPLTFQVIPCIIYIIHPCTPFKGSYHNHSQLLPNFTEPFQALFRGGILNHSHGCQISRNHFTSLIEKVYWIITLGAEFSFKTPFDEVFISIPLGYRIS